MNGTDETKKEGTGKMRKKGEEGKMEKERR